MNEIARPPFDLELESALSEFLRGESLTLDALERSRAGASSPPIHVTIGDRPVECDDYSIAGYGGGEIVVSVLTPRDHVGDAGSGIFFVHGGGMVAGDRWSDAAMLLRWVEQYGAIVATVEYRLAPEYPDPVPVEDSFAALMWFSSQAAELGFDPTKVIVAGVSAGGGIAAGLALLARDRGGPALSAQLLVCPMLDDRDSTLSTIQYSGAGIWDRESNRFGWRSLLGDRTGTADVTMYAAPARASDLGNLPPAYLDVGSAEPFRDEVVDYASRIWAAGGVADLHVWGGAFHGHEMARSAAISMASIATREAWLARHLSPRQPGPSRTSDRRDPHVHRLLLDPRGLHPSPAQI